jgi:hypothetical protein
VSASPSLSLFSLPLYCLAPLVVSSLTSDSTITPKFIEENFNAMHVQLTADESQHVRDLVDKASVFGDRWPPQHAIALFADTPLPKTSA